MIVEISTVEGSFFNHDFAEAEVGVCKVGPNEF